MTWKTARWLSDRERKHRMRQIANPEERTYFGCREISSKEKARRVLSHFDSVARKYDFMNTLLSFGIHYWWKRTAIRMMGLKPCDRVLDVCGGTGDLSLMAAAAMGPSGRVMLYDFNAEMMKAGRPKMDRCPFSGAVSFVRGDAEQIAFPDNTFDAAMVGFGIRNLTHMEKGFEEMFRVLRPGGRMMCLEFSKPTAPVFRQLYDFYSFYIMPFLGELIAGSRQAYTHLPESIRMFPIPDELAAILRRIGYTHVRYRRLTNGIAVIHLAEK